MDMKVTVAAVILLALPILSLISPVSDGDEGYKTYVSPDAGYDYRTYGSGSESSPYRSEILGIRSDSDTLFVQSALEGYGLTTVTSVAGCDSHTLVIPSTVTSVSDTAFDQCTQLTRLVFLGDRPEGVLPDDVGILSLSSSDGWDGISETLDVREYGDQFSYFVLDGDAIVLSYLDSPDVTIPAEDGDGNRFVRVNDESFRDSGIESIALGDVSAIGTRAFYGCTSLKDVAFSSSIRTISDEAFRDCFSLGDVDITGATWIGFESFRYCSSFHSISVPDSLTSMGEGSFYLCRGAESIRMGKGITELPARTFGYCTSLKTATFTDIRAVDANAFNTCRELVSVSFDDSLTSIGDSAFRDCSNLADVSLGGGLRTISDHAFYDCRSLTGLSLPDTLASIGEEAFFHCNSLTDVWFAGGMPSMPKDPFRGAGDVTVHITKANAQSWSSYDGRIEIGGGDDDMTPIVAIIAIAIVVAAIFVYFIHRRSKMEGEKR